MKTIFSATVILLALGSGLHAQESPSALPIAVTLGGQAAVVLIILAFISLGSAGMRGQEEVAALPFGITIGGQPAVPAPDGHGARIGKPVRRNAMVSVNAPAGNIILNLSKTTPTDPMENLSSAVILVKGQSTSLERSVDGRDIEPGDYDLMVVANGRTASVKLTIE
jgi:hypothetical protein